MKSKILIIVILIDLFQSCASPVSDHPPREDNSVNLYEDQGLSDSGINENTDTTTSIQIAGEEIRLDEIKKGVEMAVDVTETIIDAGTEILEVQRRNDSIKLSKKKKMFAYQLGISFKNEKLLLDAYKDLTDKDGICVFKRARKEYLLIKYQSKSEDELDRELMNYRVLHAGEVIGEIRKIDLTRECGKRREPRVSGKLKSRKSGILLDCLTCK